jgi:hypothetical protein
MSDSATTPTFEATAPQMTDDVPETTVDVSPDMLEAAPTALESRSDVPEDSAATLTGVFRAFYEHYGPALCGEPLDGLVIEGGVPTQYFRNLVLEEPVPGQLRLKPLGEAWLAHAGESAASLLVGDPPGMVDLVGQLARDPAMAYPSRPLCDIRYLVIHHTGAPADLGAQAIAWEHVTQNGWPGIGYHFVIGVDGTVYRTQDLTVVSHHAAQFNPAAVGIALCGDWSQAEPPTEQLTAAAWLVADLCADLGLPLQALRGHREMVPTSCPGDYFITAWKPRLVAAAAGWSASAARARSEAAADRETAAVHDTAVDREAEAAGIAFDVATPAPDGGAPAP